MAWLSTKYKYRYEIIIDNTNIDNDLTHFPIPINIGVSTGQNNQDISNIFDEIGSNYLKICVTKSDGITKIYTEVEQWDSQNEESLIWVSKLDLVLKSSSTTILYLYFDSNAPNNNSYIGTPGSKIAQNVWNYNYIARYGMSQPLSGGDGCIIDSISNLSPATPNGSMVNDELISGNIGLGINFDGTGDYLNSFSQGFSFTAGTMQGITFDGTYIYISTTTNLYKCNTLGTILKTSESITYHFGGICIYNNNIYAVISECPEEGTTEINFVGIYDTNLILINQIDMSDYFDICLGAISYYNNSFYLAESYYDDITDDKIVKFSSSFEFEEEFILSHKSPYGIQGLEYIPWINKFRVQSHDEDYYFINTDFDDTTIEENYSYHELQDLCVAGNRILFIDRGNDFIHFSDEINTLNGGIETSVGVGCRFRLLGGNGTRRCIIETVGDWSFSIEIGTDNYLKYSMNVEGTENIIETTNITPVIDEWHDVFITYNQSKTFSKIYYDGNILSAYTCSPSTSLVPFSSVNIGTYRNADGRFFDGDISDVVISKNEISDEWIKAYHSSQIDDFLIFGEIESYTLKVSGKLISDIYKVNGINKTSINTINGIILVDE